MSTSLLPLYFLLSTSAQRADPPPIIVKIVDACAHPDFRNFWVFASGLTDVQVHLSVVDTWTGEIWERDTSLGEPFPPEKIA